MSRQEPEPWQPEAQTYEEAPDAFSARYESGPLGSLDREVANVSQAQPWQPAASKGRVVALGVTRIVLSSCGMALSIVGLVFGILTIALKGQVALGIILIVLSALGLAVCIAAMVLSIISLARRVGTVRGRSARVRGVRWPPQRP